MTATTTPTEEIIIPVQLSKLTPSPLNPRKHLRGIDTLAESIRERGIMSPLIVRPMLDGYEIGDGSRRRAGAEKAGLETAPVIVREMSDLEMLELMVLSQAHNEDLHPLDEADGYAALMQRGYDVPGLAVKLGKPEASIRRTLKLLDLGEAARSWFFDHAGCVDAAFAIARVPPAQQPEVLKSIADAKWTDVEITGRAVSNLIQHDFTLRLDAAGFDLADASLVPSAGACTTCPKRSSNQAELFADFGAGHDRCTDSGCFETKREAAWVQLKAAKKTLNATETKKVFPYGHSSIAYNAEWADANHTIYVGNRERRVGDLVGREAERVYARDPEGAIRELVPKALVERKKAAKSKSKDDAEKPAGPTPAERERKKAERLKEQVALVSHARAVSTAAKAASALFVVKGTALEAWRLLAHLVLDHAHGEVRSIVAKAHALEKGEDPTTMLEQLIGNETLSGVQALTVELLLPTRAPWSEDGSTGKLWKRTLALLGVDTARIKKEVEAELSAKADKKASAKEKAEAGERVTAAMRGKKKPAKKAPAKKKAKRG